MTAQAPRIGNYSSRPVRLVDSELVQSPDVAVDQLVARVRGRVTDARDPDASGRPSPRCSAISTFGRAIQRGRTGATSSVPRTSAFFAGATGGRSASSSRRCRLAARWLPGCSRTSRGCFSTPRVARARCSRQPRTSAPGRRSSSGSTSTRLRSRWRQRTRPFAAWPSSNSMPGTSCWTTWRNGPMP